MSIHYVSVSKNFFQARNLFFEKITSHLLDNVSRLDEITGVHETSLAFILAGLFNQEKGSYLVILPTEKEAANLHSDLSNLLDERHLGFFPELEVLPYEDVSPNRYTLSKRVDSLFRLVNNTPGFVITSCVASSRKLLPKSLFLRNIFSLKMGESYPRDEMIKQFVQLGYLRVDKVESMGEFSVRGEIIDIFSSSASAPLRISFFDEEIEEMRLFHPDSQISFEIINQFHVLPKNDNWMPKDVVEKGLAELEKTHGDQEGFLDFKKKMTGSDIAGLQNYLPFFYQKLDTLTDFLHKKVEVIAFHPTIFSQKINMHLRELQIYHDNKSKKSQIKCPPQDLYVSNGPMAISMAINPFAKRDDLKAIKVISFTNFKSNLEVVKKTIIEKIAKGYTILISSHYAEQIKRLGQIFADLKPILFSELNPDFPRDSKALVLVQANFNQGFEMPDKKIQLICENEIFGRKKKEHRHFRPENNQNLIESFIDLKEDDLVVHINHGIGLYRGLKRLEVGKKTKDFLKIEYANKSSLFIPIEQVNLIQKYIGPKKSSTKLDVLGGSAWGKIKNRVKKSVEDIASDLIKLYSKRKNFPKERFPSESYLQTQFEIDFPYEETVDQLKATELIKQDMESNEPMDRLICGDVGFGKTEIAMRAVFKCAMVGRQCAFLCPTTILSQQHYHTFVERFARFPVDIEVINRFKSSKEQKKIIEKVKAGQVDILIGTHRILSKDIAFSKLGLLIIDEEQKFGVKHKEKIREMATMIDTLTLTATPIPRTLHMSLSHIRTVSLINTPPLNRKPIQTFVTEFDQDIIYEAVRRELKRGGQIYFLHNRVETIAQMATFLGKLLPNIKIGIAHGQLEEIDLENIMNEFIARKFDLLLATTIIDSGLDISNANTIFINRADTFGLSQLYQLKGRVGRSNEQGYAYLFYQKDKNLSEDAIKRLHTISEYTELGSGFKVAMKDLEIRGAGNILGQEQSGSIMAVGFDLYCQLLDEAVADLKDEPQVTSQNTIIDIKYDGYIPDTYIKDDKEKIRVYKRISNVSNIEDFAEVKAELLDRFGTYPELIDKLFDISKLRIDISDLGVVSLIEKVGDFEITLKEKNILDTHRLMEVLKAKNSPFKIDRGNNSKLRLKALPTNPEQTPTEEFNNKLQYIYKSLALIFR